MKSRIRIIAISFMTVLLVCGCEQVIELTPDEESVIVNYSAHIISKYNVTGTEGYRFVLETPGETEETEEESTEYTEEENTDEESADNVPQSAGETDAAPEEPELPAAEAFAKALNLSGCTLVCTGGEFTDIYESVYPEYGNKLMVLHFTLENSGDESLDINILQTGPVFRVSLNGADAVTADITLLPDDLSTFMGTVGAHENRELVLLFQIPENTDTSVESLVMQLIVGEKTTKIILR